MPDGDFQAQVAKKQVTISEDSSTEAMPVVVSEDWEMGTMNVLTQMQAQSLVVTPVDSSGPSCSWKVIGYCGAQLCKLRSGWTLLEAKTDDGVFMIGTQRRLGSQPKALWNSNAHEAPYGMTNLPY